MIDVSPEFLAFLQDEEAKAEDADTDDRRAVALDFYNGEPFGDEEDGRSQLVTRDVAEVVDYMTVSILRTIVSGDRVVEFEGRSLAQDQQSDDATEVVTQSFMRRQKGYQLVHDWIKAGLLEITGVVKTYAEPQDPKRHVLNHVSPLALMAAQQQGHKVVEAEESGQNDEQGEPLYHAAVHEPQPPKFCDYAVPNEEFRCAPDARDLDTAIYMAHVPPKTISDLAKMGFDPEDLEGLGTDTSVGYLENARNGAVTNATMIDRKGANRRVAYREEHVLYDLNEDGIAERLMVHRVGIHVLSVTEEEDHPFEEWCPFPMPHRRIGQSLAEKVMDIQRTRSVVLRQTMDGFYFANAPRTFVNEDSLGESTIEDLLTVRPGSIVRYRGQVPIETEARFDASGGLQMLEQLVGERESRTGITRLNQGLDADALNKTATGTALMQAQGQQIEEYLARNFAEALARLFAKKLRTMKAQAEEAKAEHEKSGGAPGAPHKGVVPLKVDGVYKQVDPSQWDADMDLNVNVGLGSGRKDQRILYRQQLGQFQMELKQAGSRIITDDHFFANMKGFIKDAQLGTPTDYVGDPSQLPPEDPNAQKPDPEAKKAQALIQAQQQKMAMDQADQQHKQQLAGMQFQFDQQVASAKQQTEQSRAQFEASLADRKAQFEASMAERQMQFDQALAAQRAQHDHDLAQYKASSDRQAKMSKNRPGGDLSE